MAFSRTAEGVVPSWALIVHVLEKFVAALQWRCQNVVSEDNSFAWQLPMQISHQQTLPKLLVFIPCTHFDKVKAAYGRKSRDANRSDDVAAISSMDNRIRDDHDEELSNGKQVLSTGSFAKEDVTSQSGSHSSRGSRVHHSLPDVYSSSLCCYSDDVLSLEEVSCFVGLICLRKMVSSSADLLSQNGTLGCC